MTAKEVDEINIDDHENEDQIEDQLEKEEQEIIECFQNDLNNFMKEIQDEVNSANLPTQAPNSEEFFLQENKKKNQVSKSQEKIAEDLFKSKILKSVPDTFWKRFKHFDFYIIVPKFLSLGRQTEDRFQDFIVEKMILSKNFLKDFEANLNSQAVKDHVLRNVGNGHSGSEMKKFQYLKERILKEKDTLFYIVIDEAHFAPMPGKQIDNLMNDKDVLKADNTIILQVSATPYNLVTKNTRIWSKNHYDMYKSKATLESDRNKYYGVGEFVDATERMESEHLESGNGESDAKASLQPGTFTDDSQYENLVKPESEFYKYVKDTIDTSDLPPKSKKPSIYESTTRFLGHLLQYLGAFVKKKGLHISYKSKIGRLMLTNPTITDEIMKDIDSNKNGTGSMVLIRIMMGISGRFFVDKLMKLRNILGFGDNFSILLDVDNRKEKDKRDWCEKHFSDRQKRWRRDPNFEVRNYMDLEHLPCLLVVVNKGKMGITYPRSLKYYDLRQKYPRPNQGTRAAIEQDFGRVCRYKTSDTDNMLPRLLLSSGLKKITLETNKRKTRSDTTKQKGKFFKTSGLYHITPDFNNKMRLQNAKKGKKSDEESEEGEEGILPASTKKPLDDHDIAKYSSHWYAGKKHYDYENTSKCENRFLLYGRPQLGKTGVLLQTAFLIYKKIGSPQHTGPYFDKVTTEKIELEEDNYEEVEDGVSKHCEEYPVPSHIRNLNFTKPHPSKRYGDPNDEDVMNHYKAGADIPHKSVLSLRNQIYQRTEVALKTSIKREEEEYYESDQSTKKSWIDEEIYSNFFSKPLKEDRQKDPCDYFCCPIYDENVLEGNNCLGTLQVNKSAVSMQLWNLEGKCATLDPNLKFPLIMIPSSGRAESALLDLSKQMENNEEYVQIVVLHSKDPDLENYKQLLKSYPQISYFIMDGALPRKIGASRYCIKVIAENLALHHDNFYVLVMDDNVLNFDGVTLINDPFPQFGEESRCDRSQRTHISLLSLLCHFSNKNLNSKMADFSAIGFSINYDKKENQKKHAYSRQHVFAAVFLNLRKLCDIDYLKQMWAMEDIEFLNRVNSNSEDIGKFNIPNERGLIVKCKRFVIVKKKLNHGGVVIPPEKKKNLNLISWRTDSRKRSIEEDPGSPSKKGRQLISDYFSSPRKGALVQLSENIAHNPMTTSRTVESEPEKKSSFPANVSEETGKNDDVNIQKVKRENSTERSSVVIALESETSSIDDSKESSGTHEDVSLSVGDKALQKWKHQEEINKQQKEEISRLKKKEERERKEKARLKSELAKSQVREQKEKAEKEKVLEENDILRRENERLKKELDKISHGMNLN